MALRIRGSRRFRQKVLAALGELCPCNQYVVNDDGVVSAIPLNREAFCECYCLRRAGCNLLSDLIADDKRITIRRGRNKYRLRGRQVRWSPSGRPRVRTAQGRRRTPAAKTLGHELIHALHHARGDLDTTSRTNGVLDEEIDTVRGENQLRAEQGEPQRTHYGRRRVPDPGRQNLDASDREGCGCDERFGIGERRMNRRPDEGQLRAEGPLAEHLARAQAIRDAARPGFVDGRIGALRGAPYVLLETILENEESYGFVLLAPDGDRLTLATNVGAVRDGDDVDPVILDEPCVFKVAVSDKLAKRLEKLRRADLVPGVGGDPEVLDGTTEILTRVDGKDATVIALYGLDYSPLDDKPERPEEEPDRSRQRAIERVYRIWAAVVD